MCFSTQIMARRGKEGKDGKTLAESVIVDSSMCEADGEGKNIKEQLEPEERKRTG